MTWQELLTQGRVAHEPTSRTELTELRSLANQYLADARLPGLSDDGKFDRAYGAARTMAAMIIRSEGYRVKATAGSHVATFLALKATDPAQFVSFADYFDQCRSKRNRAGYEVAGIVSSAEASDLIVKVEEFTSLALAWISNRHPELS